MRYHIPLLAVLCLLAAPDLPAQEGGAADPGSPPALPRVAAGERTAPIRIDGVLDEAAWEAARAVGSFVQAEPVEGAPVDQPTEVRVLYDDEAIYVAARMYDEDPGSIARQLARRDQRGQFDYFDVSLDPDRDRRTGYRFRVTAAGVQGDAYLFDDIKEDETWNAVWASAVEVDSLGWTAEIRIPLSQVRFRPSDAPQTWGVNFARRRVASNERSFLSLESRRRHGRVSVFGKLTGIQIPEGVRRLEVRPYLLARTRNAPVEEGNPFFSGSEQNAGAGLDLRYGLGSSFTLDATVNPDFGQVEVDPAVINLTAFETFYPEQRPFFVEDARIFDFNLSGRENLLFYSRRIGREPALTTLHGANFYDVPEQTSILGAAKLTGRTAAGLSIGGLAAVTEREEARAYFLSEDSIAVFLAEPRSEYGVFRAQQELNGGRSVIGGIATAMRRDLPADGSFDFLPEAAFNAGVDFEHTWAARAWALWGFLAGSYVTGAEEALIRLQRSSNHYFQRPDARGLSVDSSATTMAGAEWRLQLERRSGRNWTGSVWAAQRTPGFEVNDAGYFRGGERLDGGMRVAYQEITPGSLFRDYRGSFFTFHNFRHEALRDPWSLASWDHAYKRGTFGLNFEGTFLNYWGINAGMRYDPQNLDDEITRGGPLVIDPTAWDFSLRGNTDRREALSLEPSLSLSNDGGGEWGWSAGMELSYRPAAWLELETEPMYRSEPDAAQYVAATSVVPFDPTYGRRYLFADLDRRTLSLDTRVNATFSPRLTLQLFLQPLLSVGDFLGYKQLARPESFAFDPLEEGDAVLGETVNCIGGRICEAGGTRYVDFDGDGAADFSFPERDFRIRSLRGNAVLRWEYRPGSTLYFVWQQRRSYRDRDVRELNPTTEIIDLLGDRPQNVFIVKANYWLSL